MMTEGMECGCDDACDFYDGEVASVFEEEWRIARKDHRCTECRRVIRKGERYNYIAALWDGSWDHFKTCEQCHAIARDYFCNCYPLGDLASQVWELLGVDIVTGEIDERE